MDDMRAAPDDTADQRAGDVLETEAAGGRLKASVPGGASIQPASPKKGFQARLVEDRDREAVRRILRDLHGTSVFRGQDFSDRKMDKMFDRVAARPPEMAGIVAEHDGAVVGAAWAMVSEYLLTENSAFVTVHLIAVDRNIGAVRRAKAFLTLLTAIKQWAASKSAKPIFVHVMTGSNLASTDKLVKSFGGHCIGGNYAI